MDLNILWMALIGGIITLTGFFGWNHKTLKAEIDRLEAEMHTRATYADLRAILDDKLAIKEVEYRSLSLQIDELKLSQKELTNKIERLLQIALKS